MSVRMKNEPETIDARKAPDWLAKAVASFDAGRLRSVTGLTVANEPEIEELLQHMAAVRPKSERLPDDFVFNLDFAPPGLG